MHLLALFFAGAFLCNAIPHLAAGLRGEFFPTPFAKPSGRGPSAPLVNFLWGAFNAAVGAMLASFGVLTIGANAGSLVFLLGALALGAPLSNHFSNVRNGS